MRSACGLKRKYEEGFATAEWGTGRPFPLSLDLLHFDKRRCDFLWWENSVGEHREFRIDTQGSLEFDVRGTYKVLV